MNDCHLNVSPVIILILMATNQNEEFVQLLYGWWRTTQQTVIKKKSSAKIATVRPTLTLLILSQWKLSVAAAKKSKAHEQRQ